LPVHEAVQCTSHRSGVDQPPARPTWRSRGEMPYPLARRARRWRGARPPLGPADDRGLQQPVPVRDAGRHKAQLGAPRSARRAHTCRGRPPVAGALPQAPDGRVRAPAQTGTDYGPYLANEPSPLHTTTIVDRCTEKLVDDWNKMRANVRALPSPPAPCRPAAPLQGSHANARSSCCVWMPGRRAAGRVHGLLHLRPHDRQRRPHCHGHAARAGRACAHARKSRASCRTAHCSAHAAALPTDWRPGAAASLCSRERAPVSDTLGGRTTAVCRCVCKARRLQGRTQVLSKRHAASYGAAAAAAARRSCWRSATRWACLTRSRRWRSRARCASCTAWCWSTRRSRPTSPSRCPPVRAPPRQARGPGRGGGAREPRGQLRAAARRAPHLPRERVWRLGKACGQG